MMKIIVSWFLCVGRMDGDMSLVNKRLKDRAQSIGADQGPSDD